MIFTNEFRYNALAKGLQDADVRAAFDDLLNPKCSTPAQYWVPSNYSIRKDRESTTTLSLLHPAAQLKIGEFYERFSETIIESCGLSPCSLRYPTNAMRVYTAHELESDATPKAGEVHTEPEPDEIDIASVTSYFSYRSFNLLGAFYDSRQMISLEKRFSTLRTLDVSRCFYNIYTHSVTWAVKSKAFSKENANRYSFEQQFDKLMQTVNYNETNGIVVGPEVSRIFAEVIFQRIDRDILEEFSAGNSIIQGKDFEVRRYVDDFFLFANSKEILDRLEACLERALERYKLFVNAGKRDEFTRPFITPISMAKRDVRRILGELREVVASAKEEQSVLKLKEISRAVWSKTQEARLTIGQHGIGFHNVSGWSLSFIQSMISELLSVGADSLDAPERLNCVERSLWSIYALAFYIVSLDLRVSTTYALGRILALRESRRFQQLRAKSDWIDHVIEQEMIDLSIHAHSAFRDRGGNFAYLEELNVLVLGSHFYGNSFVENSDIRLVLDELLERKFSYFGFVCLKFCLLKAPLQNGAKIIRLNRGAIIEATKNRRRWNSDSESYHLLCDLLSSPDLGAREKSLLWKHVIGQPPSNAVIDALTAVCGFIDWQGLRLSHTLRRKRLRPVYE